MPTSHTLAGGSYAHNKSAPRTRAGLKVGRGMRPSNDAQILAGRARLMKKLRLVEEHVRKMRQEFEGLPFNYSDMVRKIDAFYALIEEVDRPLGRA